jgi:tape measure domain-containing protein
MGKTSIESFRIHGRVEVDPRAAHKSLKATEADARSVATAFKGLKGEIGSLSGRGGFGGGGSFLPGLANISNIIQGLPQIGQLAGALVSPLTDAAQAGVRFNAFLETTRIGLKTTMFGGDMKAATSFLGELRDFAQNSPFRTEGLVKTAQYMGAVGFKSKEVLPILKDVGDAVAATGAISEEAVQGTMRAFGKMRSEGRVTAETMEMLTDNNIDGWGMLAHAIGKTVGETRKLSEQGKLDGGAAVTAIRAQMRARYGGMMDELQGTFTGRMSALDDAMQAGGAKATEGLTQSISDTLAAGLQRQDLIGSLAGTINTAITPVAGLIKTAAVGLLGGGLTSGLAEGINAGKGLVTQTVKDFALDSVIGTFKSLFKINSPSLVMDEIGQSIGEGFENGATESLDAAQQEIVKKIIAIGQAARAKTDEIKAALATAWVESRFRNLNHGDRDSLGVMQQRPSQGWGTPEQIMNPDYAIQKFYGEAMRRRGRGLAPGALAQSVQRSGYPERYQEALPFVNQVIQSLGAGSGIEAPRVRKAWEVLAEFAQMRGFTVTSTTGGKHGKHSAHYPRNGGTAIDIRTKNKRPEEVQALIDTLRSQGVYVIDERNKPNQPHVHAQFGTRGIKAGAAHLYGGKRFTGQAEGTVSSALGLVTTSNPLPVMVMAGASPSLNLGKGGDSEAVKQIAPQLKALKQPLAELPVHARSAAQVFAMLPPAVGVATGAAQQNALATTKASVAAGEFAKSVITSGKKIESAGDRMMKGLPHATGMIPGQQVGRKRGIFSKLLGIASPFLNFIPGVGPLLSTLASIGSSAIGGDYAGAIMGAAGGFASGGAFRRSSAASAAGSTPRVGGVNMTNPGGLSNTITTTGNTISNNLSGARAMGGPVTRGRAYLVGENRPEVFTPNADGWIHPDASRYGGRSGSGSGTDSATLASLLRVIGSLEQKIVSMRPGDVVGVGSRENPRAIGAANQRAMELDPKRVEWMQRRVNGQ